MKINQFLLRSVVSVLMISSTAQMVRAQQTTPAQDVLSTHPSLLPTNLGVVPSVKGEFQVNLQGSLGYTVPIDVPKGVNDFAPNIALAYNSDGGSGQAGYGWNIVGLSMISQGGKSRRIDGVYQGPQFDETDPFYLDGQRLIRIGTSNEYTFEKISKVKVTKLVGDNYHFKVQYLDGRVGYYKQLVTGQYYISKMVYAYDNEVLYAYIVANNTPYLDRIAYGKTGSSTVYPFSIQFGRIKKRNPTLVYLNGDLLRGDFVIGSISVQINNEVYRKYELTYDWNSNGQERLRRVSVFNQNGESLKPLAFGYGDAVGEKLATTSLTGQMGMSDGMKSMSNVVMGDFYGDGEVTAMYIEELSNGKRKLMNSKKGFIEYVNEKKLYVGRVRKRNGKISERDQLIMIGTDVIESHPNNLVDPEYNISCVLEINPNHEDGAMYNHGRISFRVKDVLDGDVSSASTEELVGSKNTCIMAMRSKRLTSIEDLEYAYTGRPIPEEWGEVCTIEPQAFDPNFVVGDFNRDGLIDIVIFSSSERQFGITSYNNQNCYSRANLNKGIESVPLFIEFGKQINSQAGIIPTKINPNNTPQLKGDGMNMIEFDGDGVPEIFQRNRSSFSILKLDLKNNKFISVYDGSLSPSGIDKSPLTFGDFNGDGLTDFIFPKKMYDVATYNNLEDLYADVNRDRHEWVQYLSTGKGFLSSVQDFTSQKLFYCVPSQKHIIEESSFLEKLWSGKMDEYKWTVYGMATVFAVDYNNDGKSDLVSFNKFGKIYYKSNDLKGSTVTNEPIVLGYNRFSAADQAMYDEAMSTYMSTTEGGDMWAHSAAGWRMDEIKAKYIAYDSTFNTMRFYESVPVDENTKHIIFRMKPSSVAQFNTIPVSPFAFIINDQRSNGLSSYTTTLKVFDPHQNRISIVEMQTARFTENYLQTIDNGTGVVQKVEYVPMHEWIVDGANEEVNKYYRYKPNELSYSYPLHIHKSIPQKYLVSKLTTLFDGKSLTKEYWYENAIQHLDGLGFLGFQRVYTSDPYESELSGSTYVKKTATQFPTMWMIQRFNPAEENNLAEKVYGFFDGNQLTKASHSKFTYQKLTQGLSYLYLEKTDSTTDYRKLITTYKTNEYDTLRLLLKKSRLVYANTTPTASTESEFTYQDPFSNGEHYFYAKISTATERKTAYGNTFTTKDAYTYTSRGVPSTHTKYSNTGDSIVTSYQYYDNGNVKQETVTAHSITPLTTVYNEYDATARYVTKVTQPDGLSSTRQVNVYGQVSSEVSPLGQTTTHRYDSWGNRVMTTDPLGVRTSVLMYRLPNGQYAVTTIRPGSPEKIAFYDRMDRNIKTTTASIGGKWVSQEVGYDIYGNKIKQSLPYFDDGTNVSNKLWDITAYDVYDRPVMQSFHNGRVIKTQYGSSKTDHSKLAVLVLDEQNSEYKYEEIDALGNVTKHQDRGGSVTYTYYANGTLRESRYDKIIIKVEQDGWGNKTMLYDPSAGTYRYTYDALGKKLTEQTPKGLTTYTYDGQGKLQTEVTRGDSTFLRLRYAYNSLQLPVGIAGTNGTDTFSYATEYDDLYRIKRKIEYHPQFTYTSKNTYDALGRVSHTETSTVLKGGVKSTYTYLGYMYDGRSGMLVKTEDQRRARVVKEIKEVNAKGMATEFGFGNGYTAKQEYNAYFLPTKILHDNWLKRQTAVSLSYASYDVKRSLLKKRVNDKFLVEESFSYDELDRLTQEDTKIGNTSTIRNYTYYANGRIDSSSQMGKYKYKDSTYKLEGVDYNSRGWNILDSVRGGSYSIIYGTYKQPISIYLPNEKINYEYNLLRERCVMYYGSGDSNKMNRPLRKYYSSDKSVEIKVDRRTNRVEILTYLDGDPYSASAVQRAVFVDGGGGSETVMYLHRDYQGTILAISDEAGGLIEERYFDAWGNLIRSRVNGRDTNVMVYLDRGYTGHEHLTVGLIHMNGRLYDPEIRQFLSADNFIQDPYNTQNFNRFGYVLNNPLSHIDPSGEFGFLAFVAIGIAVAAITNGINNVLNGIPFWYGMGKSMVVGGVSAAISCGIGAAANGISTFVEKALFQAAMHGMSGGLMNVMDGGNFWSGFASGAISSLVSSAVGGLGNGFKGGEKASLNAFGESAWSKATMIAAGGLSGGLGSVIAGGNFWDGMRQGLITSGLNHALHYGVGKMLGEGRENNPTKKTTATTNSNQKNKSVGVLQSDQNKNTPSEIAQKTIGAFSLANDAKLGMMETVLNVGKMGKGVSTYVKVFRVLGVAGNALSSAISGYEMWNNVNDEGLANGLQHRATLDFTIGATGTAAGVFLLVSNPVGWTVAGGIVLTAGVYSTVTFFYDISKK